MQCQLLENHQRTVLDEVRGRLEYPARLSTSPTSLYAYLQDDFV